MNPPGTFKPAWPRIFLETELADALAPIPSNARLLNLGCGTEGRYAELLARFDVDGVDIAESKQDRTPWRFHRCDAQQLPFADATFDVAIAIESFEHIDNNVAAMRELVRTLKNGGVAIVTTPTRWTWIFEFGRHGPHYYTLDDLKELAQGAGLEVQRAQSCGGLVFYLANLVKSWLSPLGIRLMRRSWWPTIDRVLLPLYVAAYTIDPYLSFPPVNWFLVCKKPPTV